MCNYYNYTLSSSSSDIVDLGSTQIQKGTQIVPLKNKILNGYNDEVAIRRLVDVTDEQREKIHQTMMKVITIHKRTCTQHCICIVDL